MILLFISFECEFAVSEFWELDDLVFGMRCSFLLWLVTVCGPAVLVGRAHIDVASVLAGARAISGDPASPAWATARGAPVRILQGFILSVGIRIGGKRPN